MDLRMPTRSLRYKFTSAISGLLAIAIGGTGWTEPADCSAAFGELRADTAWDLRAQIPLQFQTYHPQGMTRVGDRWFLSSVQAIDRANEKGVGHLFEFDSEGRLVRELTLADGAVYHPGGIDFDGETIWLSLAEYRPDSTSIVYRIDPESFEAVPVFRFADHLGAVVHLRESRLLIGVSWGSQRIFEWDTELTGAGWGPVDPEHPRVSDNPSQYVAYQDLQQLSRSGHVLASGVRNMRAPGRGIPAVQFGGIDLLEFPGGAMRHGVPITLATPSGVPMCQNPFYAEIVGDELRLAFVPEDDQSTLYVYAPRK